MKYLFAMAIVVFATTANAGGYKEQGAWNFLSPMHKQFMLNRLAMIEQKKAGGFENGDFYYITQMNTNIGNMTNITGDNNDVDQDNDGNQAASNNVESDGNGNLTIEGGYDY